MRIGERTLSPLHRCADRARPRQIRKQDVSDHATVCFGDQRHANEPAVAQRVHESGLVLPTEGESVDDADGVDVGGGFDANRDRRGGNRDEPAAGSDDERFG